MIVYDLKCESGHTFEGWFDNQKAFEDQSRKKQISCPVCGETSVAVVPSSFFIRNTPASSEKSVDMPEKQVTIEKTLEFLEKNFEDVGGNFAKEALKMHYDVTEKRNIRGTSTEAEEEMLKKEDVKFFKVPIPHLDS